MTKGGVLPRRPGSFLALQSPEFRLMTVREVAATTGRGESTIRSHVKHMLAKHDLSRQAELVRLVLALGGALESRR